MKRYVRSASSDSLDKDEFLEAVYKIVDDDEAEYTDRSDVEESVAFVAAELPKMLEAYPDFEHLIPVAEQHRNSRELKELIRSAYYELKFDSDLDDKSVDMITDDSYPIESKYITETVQDKKEARSVLKWLVDYASDVLYEMQLNGLITNVGRFRARLEPSRVADGRLIDCFCPIDITYAQDVDPAQVIEYLVNKLDYRQVDRSSLVAYVNNHKVFIDVGVGYMSFEISGIAIADGSTTSTWSGKVSSRLQYRYRQ